MRKLTGIGVLMMMWATAALSQTFPLERTTFPLHAWVPVDRELHWEPTTQVKKACAPILCDVNALQLEAATQFGLVERLQTRDAAEAVTSNLVLIENNPHYRVDTLTYSIPYLTAHAAKLVDDIAVTFSRRVQQKGLGHYRLIVTSVLRTVEDVFNLRASGNRNAVLNSTHCYATTFDISYERFFRVGWFADADPETLTKILVGVVQDFRERGECYAIFERRESCVHVTVRY
ncbi:MAG: hypothetical protein IK000_03245 [Bacteroidaceae bacterium]|nr:hypothetical protein [Bacteroidaceae bacterium]